MDEVWYPLRVTYHREMRMKAEFEGLGYECFVPMVYETIMEGERRMKRLVPSIHNLIFVHITPGEIAQVRAKHPDWPIRYFMDRETKTPIIVPDAQRRNFFRVAGRYDENIVYLDVDTSCLHTGTKVRVMGGAFEGAEGYIKRVKGDRRVVVEIRGVVAVATTFVHPSLIEVVG